MTNARAIIERLTRDEATSIFARYGVSDADHLSSDDLKAAWKKLSQQHHPDVGGDVRAMQNINAAYDELKGTVGYSGKTTASPGPGTGAGQARPRRTGPKGFSRGGRIGVAEVFRRAWFDVENDFSHIRFSEDYWRRVLQDFGLALTDYDWKLRRVFPMDVLLRLWRHSVREAAKSDPTSDRSTAPWWTIVEDIFVKRVITDFFTVHHGTDGPRSGSSSAKSWADSSFTKAWKEAKAHVDATQTGYGWRVEEKYWLLVLRAFPGFLSEREGPELRFGNVLKIWRDAEKAARSWMPNAHIKDLNYWVTIEKVFLKSFYDKYAE